jgi:hypothetical protein
LPRERPALLVEPRDFLQVSKRGRQLLISLRGTRLQLLGLLDFQPAHKKHRAGRHRTIFRNLRKHFAGLLVALQPQ